MNPQSHTIITLTNRPFIYLNKLIRKFIHHKDLYLLLVCFILLAIALFRPTVPVKHNIYSYFMVIDITQSMNTVDMKINGKPVSRIAYTKQISVSYTHLMRYFTLRLRIVWCLAQYMKCAALKSRAIC